MTKYCPKCGREQKDKSKFCVKCGYSFKNTKSKSSFDIRSIIIAVLIVLIIVSGAHLVSLLL